MGLLRSFGPFAALAVLFVAYLATFTVDEREVAVQFQLGKVIRSDFEPGLYFQFPFINNVRKFDGRILTLDADAEPFPTVEKKNVNVDSFAKWRIDDAKAYYVATGGNETQAASRLSQIIRNSLKSEFAKRTIQEVVSGERNEIMRILTETANRQAAELGISIVDVRIKRIDLPTQVSNSVFERMRAERKRVANEFRSEGREIAEGIGADADRQRTVLLAEAYREAEQLRGEGDAKSAEVYAAAYGKDPEFYGFYRSLNAYRETFKDKGDLLVLEPDSEFFRYFGNAAGR